MLKKVSFWRLAYVYLDLLIISRTFSSSLFLFYFECIWAVGSLTKGRTERRRRSSQLLLWQTIKRGTSCSCSSEAESEEATFYKFFSCVPTLLFWCLYCLKAYYFEGFQKLISLLSNSHCLKIFKIVSSDFFAPKL